MRRLAIILVWEICRFIDIFLLLLGVLFRLLLSQSFWMLFSFIFCRSAWVFKLLPQKDVCALVKCLCGTVRVWAIDIVNGCVYLLCAFSILTKSFSRLTQQFIYVVSQWWRQLNLSTRRTLFNGLSLCENETADLSST